MASEVTSGQQACTLDTEHTLSTQTSPGVYQLVLDLNPLAGGASPDILEVRIYEKARSAGTSRLAFPAVILVGGLAPVMYESPPFIAIHEAKFCLYQSDGTGRTFDWSLRAI